MNPNANPPSPGRKTVPKYSVFEITFESDEDFDNPFWQPKVAAELVSPDGRSVGVEGYYHGGKQWRVRFAPDRHGLWRYKAKMTAPGGLALSRAGAFLCEGTEGDGPLRLSRRNPFRMEYDSGRAFYPIGLQTCGYFNVGFDGPGADGKWRKVSARQWCKEFQGAVNLLRWQLGAGTTDGCALPLIPVDGPADRYDTELAGRMDDLLRLQKAHGFAHIMVLFQDMSPWGNRRTAFGNVHDLEQYKSLGAENLPLQEKYIRYVIARFGCFVDVWEMFNEEYRAGDDYLAHLAKVIRQADPYDHLITTSYPRPGREWCEIIAPHKYFRIPANDVDVYLAKELARYKSYGKVVQYTEGGNKGWLSNYDPVKWRVAAWTAFMNESGTLLWSMSGTRTKPGKKRRGGNSNAYIGPETRRAWRVLNEFSRDLPIEMRPIDAAENEPHDALRTYALSNGRVTVLYVHHFADYSRPYSVAGGLMTPLGRGRFRAEWIRPADGASIATLDLESSGQLASVPMPRVKIDAACRIDRLE